MDVFSAFPNAIVSDQWEIGEVNYGTEEGSVFSDPALCSVIFEEGNFRTTSHSPDVAYEGADILIYAKPKEMPSLVPAILTNAYMWHDKLNGFYYEIKDASIGKNMETGEIEHIEFLLKQTEIANE